MLELLKKAPCTIVLVASNVLVFFGLTLFGMTEDPTYMLRHGAMSVSFIFERHEYYRIFTSMFLHFGFEHMMGNMVMLGVLGWQLEVELGRIKYMVLYLISGLCGQIAMIWYDIIVSSDIPFAGASGAVFGVLGALMWIGIKKKGRVGTISSRGLLFVVALSLYYGFTSPGVANLAHVGSLVAGFLLGILLYRDNRGKDSPFFRD